MDGYPLVKSIQGILQIFSLDFISTSRFFNENKILPSGNGIQDLKGHFHECERIVSSISGRQFFPK